MYPSFPLSISICPFVDGSFGSFWKPSSLKTIVKVPSSFTVSVLVPASGVESFTVTVKPWVGLVVEGSPFLGVVVILNSKFKFILSFVLTFS